MERGIGTTGTIILYEGQTRKEIPCLKRADGLAMTRRHFLFSIENDMMQIYKVKHWKFEKLRIFRISWQVNAFSDEKTQLIMERLYISSIGTHFMEKFSKPCKSRKKKLA